jgi:hypothetical protein
MPFLRAPSALLTHLPGHFAASAEIVSWFTTVLHDSSLVQGTESFSVLLS